MKKLKIGFIIKGSTVNSYEKDLIKYITKNKEQFEKPILITLKQDKKNDDEKINFLLLKKIGMADSPNKFRISTSDLKKYCKTISQY